MVALAGDSRLFEARDIRAPAHRLFGAIRHTERASRWRQTPEVTVAYVAEHFASPRPRMSGVSTLSPRLKAIVEALPLRLGMRVLEIGGGPGAAARAVAGRIGDGHILMIDRSGRSIELAAKNAATEIDAGLLSVRQVAVEDFALLPTEEPFDLAFAVRVGALDGRHPETGRIALHRIADALTPQGRLFIDGGDPLRQVQLPPGAPDCR